MKMFVVNSEDSLIYQYQNGGNFSLKFDETNIAEMLDLEENTPIV